MDHSNDTVLALSRITDNGLFERLATAVLRSARPELYGNLTHPGVNAEGKTVKSPVDGISFVPGATPRHMVVAHHTSGLEEDLKKKWLHDPSTVKPRKRGKPTAPAGDLIKTVAVASDERLTSPDLLVTLALTTNQEPPHKLTRVADGTAASCGITLDIWSRTRIADHLDNTANGQWLRRTYLGIEQERLSADLLHHLSRESLEAYQPQVRSIEQIPRDSARTVLDGLRRPVGFLVGESGYGKSVACYQYLAQHIERGGFGLILPHDVLASSIVLDQAIDQTLRQLHPLLAQGSGGAARALCSEDMPLLIVVEDISRSGQAVHLVDRLAKWASGSSTDSKKGTVAWRLICPIWPELFGALGDETRKHVEPLAARLGPFTHQEARDAVLHRASLEKIDLSPLDVDAITDTLGCDPLLIGLHNLKRDTLARNVISTFIAGSVDRLATTGTLAACEYMIALRSLAGNMLQRRQLDPAWSDILTWYPGASTIVAALRELVKFGEVIRLVGQSQNTRVGFRHDRVRQWLLMDAAIHALQAQTLDDSVFSEPFFADVIGAALVDPAVPLSTAERARLLNPLALFYGLRAFREPSTQQHRAVLSAIDAWLSIPDSHSQSHESLRFAALGVLAETHSSYVVPLLARFRERSWSSAVAGLSNGDLKSGLRLCHSLEPGMGAAWRDRAIEQARARFGVSLVEELTAYLNRATLTSDEVVSALRLAGHFADTSLANAIEECWGKDTERIAHLDAYLWAAAQCGGDITARLLAPICDAWGALSDQPEKKGHYSERNGLTAHHVAWSFWETLPHAALAYFIQRASQEDLRWPITYMLHGVDHPDAVEFLALENAKTDQKLEGTKSHFLFSTTISDHWERWQRDRSKPMSKQSRARLQGLWTNVGHDKYLRRQSFRIWAATSHPDDLALLREVAPTDMLANDILRARLKRADHLAIPAFIERLRSEDMAFWWHYGRHVWSNELTATLDQQLSLRGTTFQQKWDSWGDEDWMMSEMLILRLDPAEADLLLHKHWSHLRFSPLFIQAALYAATPRLLSMVRTTVDECPTPSILFEHINRHFGVRTSEHPGVTRVQQIEALIPYLAFMEDSVIHDFWEVCNKRGWTDLRRTALDAHLGTKRKTAGLDDASLLEELDEELKSDRPPWLDYWIERHLGNGRSIENIMHIVRQWLASHKSVTALQVAASIVVQSGSRADIDLLTEGSDEPSIAAEIIADTTFAVMRRTLS